MLSTLVIVFLLSYFAFSLSAICGGGAGMLLIPLLGNQIPVTQVPSAISLGTFTGSASRILVFKKSIHWAIVRWFVPAAVPAVWLGAWALKFIDPVYISMVMGLFLISNIPFLFKKEKELHLITRPKNSVLIAIGFSAGLLSGLTGAVGLLFNKFYLRYQLSKEEIVATRAANEIILHLIKIILYSLFGLISSKAILFGAIVAAAAILSTLTIRFILPLITEMLFKRIGYLAMVFSGFLMLIQASGSVLNKNDGHFSSSPITKGLEAKLKWQKSDFALEFTYDEGFEFEQIIPFSDLNKGQQEFVNSHKAEADCITIEAVYSIKATSYEAYYYKDNVFISKMDFN
jgi:uncharacterized membrane protein YfcA